MRNAMIILVNMLPCFLLSQCPETTNRVLIETYQTVASHLYESHWPEWKDVSRHLLLVGDTDEYLFGSQYSDSTFVKNCEGIPYRPSTMNKYLLATFPYINGQPTIIIGTPENTRKNPLAWTITLLHEHFHQLQFSHPDYYVAQKALDLDKGDQTGMWVLNHPFPYNDSLVVKNMDEMTSNLLDLHENAEAEKVQVNHLRLKKELKDLIGETHYRYLNLQLWQEGFARFLELSFLEHWITHFNEIDQDRFEKSELETYLRNYKNQILNSLETNPLDQSKRLYFYAIGAAEAMLIKAINPNWKSIYFDELFSTDHLLAEQ